MPGHDQPFAPSGGFGAATKGIGDLAMNPAAIGLTGGMSAVAGLAGKGIGMAVDYFKNRNNDVKEERAGLLNRQNQFNMALAQDKAFNPTRSLKQFKESRDIAGRLNIGRVANAGDFGKSNASDFSSASKGNQRLAKSFEDLANNNLQENEEGILKFLAPKLQQAVSEKLFKKGKDFGNFRQGGEKLGFGTKGGKAHKKNKKGKGIHGGDFDEFLKRIMSETNPVAAPGGA